MYCDDGCRDGAAERRRIRRAARKLGPWRPWFAYLAARERAVLERRLAGDTHRAIGEAQGWTRQYSQQVERCALRTIRRAARTHRLQSSDRSQMVFCPAHGS